MRFRVLALFAVLLALAATFAACGGGDGESNSNDPQEIVDEATLEGIDSADLSLYLNFAVTGEKDGRVYLSFSGPFQSESGEEYPELDIAAQANGTIGKEKIDREAGLTLLGNKAYVAYEGTEYEVDPTTFNYVKAAIQQRTGGEQAGRACQEAVGKLHLADFIENLKNEGNSTIADASTTKISGDLDPVAAIGALIEIVEDPVCSEQLNAAGSLPSVAELKEAQQEVQQGVKDTSVLLYVGDDHIVRRIMAEATIEPPKDSDKGPKRIDFSLEMELTGVNQDQTISAPSSSQPLSNLFVKLGINPIELLGALNGQGGPDALGNLLDGLDTLPLEADEGSSGGGQESYYECLGGARTAADLQKCAGLLQ